MAYSVWSVIAGETPTATKWNILGSNDADFDSRVNQLEIDKTLFAEDDGATVTFDLNVSKLQTVTLEGNRTLALANVPAGKFFVIRLVQGTGGSKTVNWWSGIKWINNVIPPLSTVAGKTDIFGFLCVSAGVYEGALGMPTL